MNGKLEVISKTVAEKLDAHAKVIHTLIEGQRRGAAEQFGYAFLAGRALLQAKDVVPNGHNKTPHAGFKNWVVANFREITLRTAENWMLFAESIIARAQIDLPRAPLLLGSVEMAAQSHESILGLVPQVMDGKGMMRFMRECRLLRPRTRRTRRRPPAASTNTAGKKFPNAQCVWEEIVKDLRAGVKILPRIESAEDLKRYLAASMEASHNLRSVLKGRGVE